MVANNGQNIFWSWVSVETHTSSMRKWSRWCSSLLCLLSFERERERALLSLGNLIELQPFIYNVWLRQKKNLTLRKLCGIVSVLKNLTIIFRLTYFSLLKYVFVFIETVVYLYICYTWLGIISTRRAHVY